MNQVQTSDEHSGTKLVNMAGAVESQGLDNPCSLSDYINETSGERTPLIRPRRSTDQTEDTASQENSDSVFTRRGSVAVLIKKRQNTSIREKMKVMKMKLLQSIKVMKMKLVQPINSVLALLLIVIIGFVLVFAANLKTDDKVAQVKPQHVLVYLMILISVFIAWSCYAVISQKLHSYSLGEKSEYDTYFPRRLLTGVGIFGTVSATTQILHFLDFIKCSQHVDGLSYIYAVYPLFKITFIYFQMHFFYKLSYDGILDSYLPGGVFFVMVTLATNLCIWVSVFFSDVSSNSKLSEVSWLNHYYYGAENYDLCANESLTRQGSYKLHALVNDFAPYMSTFSMEYALLASGLLLHIWMVLNSLRRSKSERHKQPWKQRRERHERERRERERREREERERREREWQREREREEKWSLWRVGFIFGLLAIPMIFVAYLKEQTAFEFAAPKVILYVLQASFFVLLMMFCFCCIWLLDEKRGFVRKEKQPMKLEVVLLGISAFLGFPAFDLAGAFAAVCELHNLPVLEVVCYGICSMCELFSICTQLYFIKKAYQYELPDVPRNGVKKAAQSIRQYASFALVMNIGYWAAKTYELRRTSADPSIAEQFFGKYTWFALSHFSLPLCIFFYFHLAICYANIVFSLTPLWQTNDPEDE